MINSLISPASYQIKHILTAIRCILLNLNAVLRVTVGYFSPGLTFDDNMIIFLLLIPICDIVTGCIMMHSAFDLDIRRLYVHWGKWTEF